MVHSFDIAGPSASHDYLSVRSRPVIVRTPSTSQSTASLWPSTERVTVGTFAPTGGTQYASFSFRGVVSSANLVRNRERCVDLARWCVWRMRERGGGSYRARLTHPLFRAPAAAHMFPNLRSLSLSHTHTPTACPYPGPGPHCTTRSTLPSTPLTSTQPPPPPPARSSHTLNSTRYPIHAAILPCPPPPLPQPRTTSASGPSDRCPPGGQERAAVAADGGRAPRPPPPPPLRSILQQLPQTWRLNKL